MKINIISTDNQYLASDYTITNLVDGNDIFLNTAQDVNIINKSKAWDYVGYKKKDSRIHGLRLVDDVVYWFNRFYANESISFFIVSSYEAYLLLTNELQCKKPVLYLEDVTMTPSIPDDINKSNRVYTFSNPINLDNRLLDMGNMDIYTADSYFMHDEMVNCNFRGRAKGKFIEWTPDSVTDYAKYNTAYIYYNKKHPENINKLKSINRMSQCFYFNQEVVTNYPGRFHPDIEKELTLERIDGEFYRIAGNTRKIYDMFFSCNVIKNNLINFCSKLNL
ncbi:MAG: hypothetical protein CVU55_00235 [Deltaproteobacteria bacterium HGW-Deltaproteobacteria-13]|jgi:hypothetical protein|nr:MAG: hypothetical protein CVU55_00235 [Deltaproteobacteria bacterium HGW-Deltaproteobacteria-13]